MTILCFQRILSKTTDCSTIDEVRLPTLSMVVFDLSSGASELFCYEVSDFEGNATSITCWAVTEAYEAINEDFCCYIF